MEISVEDDGPGMPERSVDEAYLPFFSTKGEGLGLGLSIAYEAARRNGGILEVTSSEGEGTRVVVQLPMTGPDGAGQPH